MTPITYFFESRYLHTYIHNCFLQTFSQEYDDLACHTIYVVYVNESTPNDRFFLKNISWQFLFTHRVLVRNLMRGNCRRDTFCILF